MEPCVPCVSREIRLRLANRSLDLPLILELDDFRNDVGMLTDLRIRAQPHERQQYDHN